MAGVIAVVFLASPVRGVASEAKVAEGAVVTIRLPAHASAKKLIEQLNALRTSHGSGCWVVIGAGIAGSTPLQVSLGSKRHDWSLVCGDAFQSVTARRPLLSRIVHANATSFSPELAVHLLGAKGAKGPENPADAFGSDGGPASELIEEFGMAANAEQIVVVGLAGPKGVASLGVGKKL